MRGHQHASTRPAEDDEDVARFVGRIPDSGFVLFRCAGCGIWKKPEIADLEAYFSEGGFRWVCGDVACEEWKVRAIAYEKEKNERERQTQTADMSLLEAEAQKVEMARGKPESPLILALRSRVADTTKPALRRGILSIVDTYSRPGKGFLKEESVRAIQHDNDAASLFTTKIDTYWFPPKWYNQGKLRSAPEVDGYFIGNKEDTPSTALSGTRALFRFGSPFPNCMDETFPKNGVHGAHANDIAAIVDQMVQHWPVFPAAAFRYCTRNRQGDGVALIDTLRKVRNKHKSIELKRLDPLLLQPVSTSALAQRPKRDRTGAVGENGYATLKAAEQREGKRQTALPRRLLDSVEAVDGMITQAAAGMERTGRERKRRKVCLESNLEPSDDEYSDINGDDAPNLRALTAAAHPSELAAAPLSFDERSLLEMWYQNGGRIKNEHIDDSLFELAAILVPDPPLLPGQPKYTYADNVERVMRWYKTKPDWLKRHGLEADGLTHVPHFENSEENGEIDSL